MNKPFHWLLPAAVLCAPLLALAQSGRADPADAKASAPALRYQSTFGDYKAWQDAKPGDWRALNDGLKSPAAGAGHAGHAMPSAASAPAPTASKPMPGHGPHHMHGGKQ